jgi:hypothetical protein
MNSLFQLVRIVLVLLAALMVSSPSYAQMPAVHELKLLKMQIVDTVDGKDVVAFFSVTAAKQKDFPPVLSMGITYKVNDEVPRRLDIMHAQGKVKLIIYGPTIAEKNPHALIKDQLAKLTNNEFQVLAFYFRDLTPQPLEEMTLTYGLWEKRNQERRIEQDFSYLFE